MGIYFSEESKNAFLDSVVVRDKKKLGLFLPFYIGIAGVLMSLCLLSILLPIWLKEIAELEALVHQEFSAIRVSFDIFESLKSP